MNLKKVEHGKFHETKIEYLHKILRVLVAYDKILYFCYANGCDVSVEIPILVILWWIKTIDKHVIFFL